jgi:Protein of unknown function (DUF2868)
VTEEQARQVLLVMSREGAAASPPWSAADRDWATRQALANLGDQATPDTFVSTRAALALQRLLPRDRAAASWLGHRLWHRGWVLAALLVGWLAGVAVDQLGPPQHVNLLGPAVWAVVAWNLVAYALLGWPGTVDGRAPRLVQRALRWHGQRAKGLAALWARHAAPLTLQRLKLLLHAAAAALALGLISGLYLRGLVLDYRAGWQSTFLGPGAVQTLLDALLAPASALTGIVVPAVAPLQLAPGGAAGAITAPWIHLYAATLALFVVLPRAALAAWAARRAAQQVRQFPLALVGSYFEGLHPLMRPGPPRPLRLLWLPLVTPAAGTRLLGREPPGPGGERALLDSPEGERLLLEGVPPLLQGRAPLPPPPPWWRFWGEPAPEQGALQALQGRIDAVLLLTAPDAPHPPWLAALARPVVVLHDSEHTGPPVLPLRALADGWLADGALWGALAGALPDELRLQRLRATWERRQAERVHAAAGTLADALAQIALMREPLPPSALFGSSDDGAARERLAERLTAELQAFAQRLAQRLGLAQAPAPERPAVAAAQLRQRVAEGRAALVGGVVTGAVTGLKADIASGGLTLGLGALTGGVVGAVGTLLAARGINKARGTEQGHANWGEAELEALATALLQHTLVAGWARQPDEATTRAGAAVAHERSALATLWRERGPTLAARLAPLAERLVLRALGGPPAPQPYTPAP